MYRLVPVCHLDQAVFPHFYRILISVPQALLQGAAPLGSALQFDKNFDLRKLLLFHVLRSKIPYNSVCSHYTMFVSVYLMYNVHMYVFMCILSVCMFVCVYEYITKSGISVHRSLDSPILVCNKITIVLFQNCI